MLDTLKVEDVKSDLKSMVDTAKSAADKEKSAKLPEDKRKELESKKADEVKKAQEEQAKLEAQSKKNAELLAKNPDELNDDEAKQVAALVEEKQKKEDEKLSADDRIKKIKDESQKRINEVINEMKQVKDKTSKDFEELKAKLTILEQEKEELSRKVQSALPQPDAIKQEVAKAEHERINRYLDEDKSLARDKRREMSKAELEEWMLEDIVAAQEWLVDRRVRRDKERGSDMQQLTLKLNTETLLKKQKESLDRILSKDKELQDMDSEKSKLMLKVIQEKGEEWKHQPNAPELFYSELERRIKVKDTPNPQQSEIDALKKEIESMKAKIQANEMSDIGISSTRQVKRDSKSDTAEEQLLRKTMEDVGLPQDRIEAAIKKHRERE